jgi:hypothetical protein
MHRPEDFLVVFASAEIRNRVAERPVLEDAGFTLHFRQWTRQAQASMDVWKTKVHLVLEGVPPHAWEREVVDGLLGTSCSIDEVAPETSSRADLATFKVSAWTPDPESIPPARMLAIPEPEEMTGEAAAALSGELRLSPPARRTSELKLLKYKVLIHIDAVEEVLFQEERRLELAGPASSGQTRGGDSGGGGLGATLHRRQWRLGVPDRRGGAGDGPASEASQRRSYCQVASSTPSWRLPPMRSGPRIRTPEVGPVFLNAGPHRETGSPAVQLGQGVRPDKEAFDHGGDPNGDTTTKLVEECVETDSSSVLGRQSTANWHASTASPTPICAIWG